MLALSNPSSRAEAEPADVLRWSGGRALVATGSPFPPVAWEGARRPVSQANNVFIFPGVGLGVMVAEARAVTDEMFLAAARTLAARVDASRLAEDAIYPPVRALAGISRAVAVAVAGEAVRAGLAGIPADTDLEAAVDDAMWWPAYVPYLRRGRGPQPQPSRSRHLPTSSTTA